MECVNIDEIYSVVSIVMGCVNNSITYSVWTKIMHTPVCTYICLSDCHNDNDNDNDNILFDHNIQIDTTDLQ